MSEASKLLDSLTEDQISLYAATPKTESHIVIGADRFAIVPDELKRIAVQFDHNIETVTFDCPRYWDDHDMSKMKIYINYTNGATKGSFIAENISVDDDIMHFTWTITRNVTQYKGAVAFLVCVRKTDADGEEVNHWNSELNRDMYVSEGLEVMDTIIQSHPDIITQLLTRMDFVEEAEVTAEELEAIKNDIAASVTEFKAIRDEVQTAANDIIGDRDFIKGVADELADQESSISLNDKRIVNLEQVNTSELFHKNVPENALPFAEVKKIGGTTRKCTNLLPYPYNQSTVTHNGVTYTVNADGSVLANGTATSGLNAVIYLARDITFPAGTYTFAFNDTLIDGSVMVVIKNGSWFTDISRYRTITLEDEDKLTIYLQVVGNVSVTNLLMTPRINEGTEPLPYEPYFEGLRSAHVTEVESVGANLCSGILAHVNSVSVSNGVATQITTDTRTTFDFVIQTYNNSNYIDTIVGPNVISTKGRYFWSFVKNASYNMLIFGHNGLKIDVKCKTNVGHLINGNTYTISLEITNVTQGMFSWKDVQINEGSTALPYTPYQRNTLSIPAEVQALDGYGWGVNADCYNYIDWEKKQFVKRVGCVDIGTLSWKYNASTPAFHVAIADGKYRSNNALMPKYSKVSEDDIFTVDGAFTFGSNYIGGGACSFVIHDTSYTDAATFKAAMSGVMLYYELSEPVITDISDLLPDDNLIGVEGNGTVTMVNEYGYDVPSEVSFTPKMWIVKPEEFADHGSRISRNDKRIMNLEQGLTFDPFYVDDTVAYSKDAPENALPFAEVNKVGGITRKCTNLWKFPYVGGESKTVYGVTFTANSDGSITISGTNTHTTYAEYPLITTNSLVMTNANVTVSLYGTASNDVYCTIGGGGFDFSEIGVGTSKTLANNGTTNVFSYGLVRVKAGATVSNVTVYPMLNDGDTALPYEPYFEGLRSAPVTEVESVGVNLFDISKLSGKDGLVVFGDKIMATSTSNNSSVTSASRLKDVAPQLKVGDIVTLNAITTGTYKYIYLEEAFMSWYYGNSQTITEIMLNSRISFYASGVSTSATISEIMLNKGTTALPYRPYVKNILPIPAEVQALDGYGWGVNADCYNYIDWEKKQFVKRVRKKVLDGVIYRVSDKTQVSDTLSRFNMWGEVTIGNKLALSTHHHASSWFYSTAPFNRTVCSNPSASLISLFETDMKDYTVDEYNAYLAEQYSAGTPVTLYYALAEPVITDISDILPDDNLIGVEGGGTVTFKNEYDYGIPSEVIFGTKREAALPTSDGTYTLKATVQSGVVTYTWVAG